MWSSKSWLVWLLCGCWCLSAFAQSDWTLVKDDDGIQVYHRYQNRSRVPEVKITFSVRSSLAGAVTLINDASRYPEWVYSCEEAYVLDTLQPGHFYYYSRTDFPLWLADREFVLRASTWQDSSGRVYLDARAVPDYLPPVAGRIRVQTSFSRWLLTPQPGGQLLISYVLCADAGGGIPDWLTRAAINVGPVRSCKLFRAMVEAPPYQAMRLSWIEEPHARQLPASAQAPEKK